MASITVRAARHPLSFRILHEIITASILLLIVTGFYIHNPFVGGGGFLMTTVLGVHFFFAAVLIVAAVVRLIATFFGRNRDWRSFIPTWSDIKLLPRVIRYYTYLGKEPELKKKYNPLQMFSYVGAFILVVFQVISGFALQFPDGALRWFNYSLFNNEIEVRVAHFVVTWLLVIFVMIHVYLTIREKYSEIKEMHLLSSAEEESK
jgi:Ni/Fe-hydrogenase 1 B-type cytochrome subunit